MMGDGMHLMIDGLSDKSLTRHTVQRFLMAMPGAIGMMPIGNPQIERSDAGWAGYQMIAESHIALHCKGKAVHVDIFSYKAFMEGDAIELSVQMLGLEKLRTQTLARGWAVPVGV